VRRKAAYVSMASRAEEDLQVAEHVRDDKSDEHDTVAAITIFLPTMVPHNAATGCPATRPRGFLIASDWADLRPCPRVTAAP